MTSPASGVRAAVLTAAETLGLQTFPVPRVGEDDALIRVEVCGLGGSDVTQYLGKLRPSSTVYPVILGLKRGDPIPGLVTDELIYKGVTVIGAMAADYSSFERACRLIERDGDLIAQANTHAFGLDEVEAAIHTLAGDVPGADAIGVSVEPARAGRPSRGNEES